MRVFSFFFFVRKHSHFVFVYLSLAGSFVFFSGSEPD